MFKKISKYLILALKGLFIGGAMDVPGVSGGTIAVVSGIYKDLLDAIAKPFKNIPYLLSIFIGMGAGLVLFANIIEYLFGAFPIPTIFLFIGLIAGSIPYLYKKGDFKPLKWYYFVLAAVGLTLVLILGKDVSLTNTIQYTDLSIKTVIILLSAGIIAAAAMIIPGISGSFVLVLLGLYSTFIGAVKDLNIPFLVVIALGAAIGILFISKIMSWLLNKFYSATYAVILGLVIGSIIVLWPAELRIFSIDGLFALIAAAVGFTAAFFLGSSGKESKEFVK